MTAGTPELILPYGDLSARTASSKLRSGLAYAMLVGLKDKGWTHQQLGEAVDLDPTIINLLTHNRVDCSFEMAGRILFALGVSARLVLETERAGGLDAMNISCVANTKEKGKPHVRLVHHD